WASAGRGAREWACFEPKATAVSRSEPRHMDRDHVCPFRRRAPSRTGTLYASSGPVSYPIGTRT
ncbi:hypothetical protein WOLCODRAFT_26697, partial [Wolfiporia cocos MD-104 SS10]